MRRPARATTLLLLTFAGLGATSRPAEAQVTDADINRVITALLADSTIIRDAQVLTDVIGGRPTGSLPNLRAVDWALAQFRDAGIAAIREPFRMPGLWLERSATAAIRSEGVGFAARLASMPFSPPTAGMVALLVDVGFGTEADFTRTAAALKGAVAFVETHELKDLDGLFREYAEATLIEQRALAAGAAGVVYIGSRPGSLLYRHNASLGFDNRHPMAIMERDAGLRALRLLRSGAPLTIGLNIDTQTGAAYDSYNVIGEITGTVRPEEIVLIGAHLDSWDLGGGALDNGANVALVIAVAREIRRIALQPSRTLRFVLWNGEEQGIFGSQAYTKTHAAELDKHVMTTSIDIGTGRITGFFTGGRPDVMAAAEQALVPVASLGPFAQVDVPIVGTDNLDFMLEGVANLVANQESANYGPNYHARSDEFNLIDQVQLRKNAAIIAAATLRFSEMPVTWTRQTRSQVEQLVRTTDLEQQLRSMVLRKEWWSGLPGREEPK
jgi:hypothetical protein